MNYASIDWDGIDPNELAASSSELAILHIALSLAGHHLSRQPLCDLVVGLDQANTLLALRAVFHTARGPQSEPCTVVAFG